MYQRIWEPNRHRTGLGGKRRLLDKTVLSIDILYGGKLSLEVGSNMGVKLATLRSAGPVVPWRGTGPKLPSFPTRAGM